jgi:1-pyrroline-5-carboxylate dehydrogenase
MGNVVLWKPAATAMLSAGYIMKLLEEAGLPPGVINFVPATPALITDVALTHRDLAGVHFTGSTGVFNSMWKTIGKNMANYRTYPRIVGETGGKDFIVAHPRPTRRLAVALCAAPSSTRARSARRRRALRAAVAVARREDAMVAMMKDIAMGDVRDFRNFMGAVIDKKAFDKIKGYIDDAKHNGGSSPAAAQGATGYFIEPTLVESADPGDTHDVRGDLRPGGHVLRLRRREVERDAQDRGPDFALRAHRRGVLAGPRGVA